MGRKPTGRRSGPPEKQVNFDQVIYWMKLQATAEEIAAAFHMCEDTLDRRLKEEFGVGFSELKKRIGPGEAKISLRRYQFKQAEKSATMAIWLGKQWLGQRDHEEDKEDLPKRDAITELENKNMFLNYENRKLKEELDNHKSKARPELCGGNPQIQYMGGSDQSGQDVQQHTAPDL